MNVAANAGVASDLRSLETIRQQAQRDPRQAVKAAARQFEALFMQELMKSMRATTMDSGMLQSSGGELASGMLDQQYAGQLAGMPGGLAEAIARQLERQMGLAAAPAALPVPRPVAALDPSAQPTTRLPRIPERSAAAFVSQHQAAAAQAEAASGIPAAFMVAQAAHESGWGKREILHADGSPSHNLFGIKAGANWNGPVAEVTTTEFVDGVPRKVKARFRAYANHAESFADYARLMTRSERYQDVVGAGTAQDFARGLQRAGYATDPRYAEKLTRVINTTLQLQRTMG